MFELFERFFLAGLGAVSLSRKAVEELLTELKEKYRMSEEEGRAFVEKAEKLAREGREKISEMVDAEVKKVVERMGLVTREEFDALRKRVEELEEQLRKN